MLTKADFQEAIAESIADYPTIAPLYQAGDPRILQPLNAMAAMLALFSQQLEVAQTEQFDKARDGTVLADAAMRGIVRKGKAARVRIRAKNGGTTDFVVETGRNLFDANGLYWRVETPCTVPAGGEATFEATQQQYVTVTHTVSGAMPFYAIQVPESEDGAYLCSLRLSDVDGDYEYRTRYTNTFAGERVYHVEADDRQRVFIRLGCKDVVGTQPSDGHKFNILISYTNGNVNVDYDSPFAFEYIQTVEESAVELKMDAMIEQGADPISMGVLHDLAKYPSIYREEAVFLGEFSFLIRKNFPTLQFLSVWNETTEEQARGSSLDNVNALFVACISEKGGERIITKDTEEDTQPVEIPEEELTGTQQSIRRLISTADDSYRVRFFTPVLSEISMTVMAKVATSYRASDVRDKIREVILEKYGKESATTKQGRQRPLYRDVYALLREKVSALSDGDADIMVHIDGYTDEAVRPERWRFVSEDTLTVKVETVNVVAHTWGG